MKCKQNAEETCLDYPNKCHLCGAFGEDIEQISAAPAADVVSRSELAQEIFAEIENSCRVVGSNGVHYYIKDDIDELKKKYVKE